MSSSKRAFDVVVAGTLLIVLSVPLLVLCILTFATMGWPVFFRQRRAGYQGAIFTINKLRTMRYGSGPDDVRISPYGAWLRSLSLDELPELINVLKGEMSLVGPRPLLPQYLARYSPAQARRHEVRPGMTGWAQVHGRNTITWEQKFDLDVWYVDHWSMALDLRVLLLTAKQVFSGEGISAEGHATMPEFMGTEQEDQQ